MKLTFKSMEIRDFKSFDKFEFSFRDITKISGANETGKTTVADAITWLFTGRLSEWNSAGDIVPISKYSASPFVEMEIEYTDDARKQRIATLAREYKAKFNKEKKFTGDYATVCYINGAKMTVKEFDAWIDEHICKKEIFNVVFDGRYFTEHIVPSAKEKVWEVQRRMLLDICPIKSDLEFAEENDKYAPIAEQLKRYDKVTDIVAVTKQRMADYKSSTDGFNHGVAAYEAMKKPIEFDVEMTRKSLTALEAELDSVVAKKFSAMENDKKANRGRAETVKTLQNNIYLMNIEINQLYSDLNGLRNNENSCKVKLADLKERIAEAKNKLSDTPYCQTCGQKLPKELAEKVQNELKVKIYEMEEREKQQRQRLLDYAGEADAKKSEMDELIAKKFDTEKQINELIAEKQVFDYSKYDAKIDSLKTSIDDCKQMLKDVEFNADVEKKIQKLEEEQRERAKNYSELQQLLDLCKDFISYKCKIATDNINAMFDGVTFQMFKANKTNDEIRECCDIFWNGIPYQSLSYSTKFIVSLRIVEAFQKHYNVEVPIIIDNAESVDFGEDFKYQIIMLEKVSENCPWCGDMTSRRDNDGYWTCKRCKNRFIKTLRVDGFFND